MSRPMNAMRTRRAAAAALAAIAAIAAAACVALASCAPSSAEKKEERLKAAGLKSELTALEERLVSARETEARVDCLRSILDIEVMSLGDLESALKRFEKHKELLAGDPMSRIYAAIAQSMMAGKAKKIEDKLSWLMKGMRSFDDLRAEFPDEEDVLLYQASTYANFPSEVGARDEVLDILGEMADRYAAGDWRISEGVAGQIVYIYGTLGSAYPDAQSAELIGGSRDAFASRVPGFGEAR